MNAYRPFLGELLGRAGDLALHHFRRVKAEQKADGTEVTAADREIEELLVAGLTAAFPDDAIASEEGTRCPGRGGGTWYVDPIDGTSSFLEGLAHWGPTLCRVADGQVVVGAFLQPRIGELWYAERGGGAWLNDQRLRAGEPTMSPRNQSLYAPSRFHRAGPIPWAGKLRALGSTAAHLALVANGSATVTIVPDWSMWDVGCGALLTTEAGRIVCDMHGAPVEVGSVTPGLPLVAGAPNAVHRLIDAWWAARRAPSDGPEAGSP